MLRACAVYECNVLGEVYYRRMNQPAGALSLETLAGNWIFVEVHAKLNTPGQPDGIYELWMDNCGPDGLGCTGVPTLRAQHTNVKWREPGDNSLIGNLWLENWANPGTVGTELYDQFKVSTRPIEFIGSTARPPLPPPPPTGPNLALNKTVTVSSSESAEHAAAMAIDGNAMTYWSSGFSDPQWIQIDLGAPYALELVRIFWDETAFGQTYQIETSSNGTSWTTASSMVNIPDGGGHEVRPVGAVGRYVRVYGTARGSPWGYSIKELEIYGSPR